MWNLVTFLSTWELGLKKFFEKYFLGILNFFNKISEFTWIFSSFAHKSAFTLQLISTLRFFLIWILRKVLSACNLIENRMIPLCLCESLLEFVDSEPSGDVNYFYLNLDRHSKGHTWAKIMLLQSTIIIYEIKTNMEHFIIPYFTWIHRMT